MIAAVRSPPSISQSVL